MHVHTKDKTKAPGGYGATAKSTAYPYPLHLFKRRKRAGKFKAGNSR